MKNDYLFSVHDIEHYYGDYVRALFLWKVGKIEKPWEFEDSNEAK